jgi:hypothetical protein
MLFESIKIMHKVSCMAISLTWGLPMPCHVGSAVVLFRKKKKKVILTITLSLDPSLVPVRSPICKVPRNLLLCHQTGYHHQFKRFAGSYSEKGVRRFNQRGWASSEGAGKVQSRTGVGETSMRSNLAVKTSFASGAFFFFLLVYCFHPDFSFRPQFQWNWCSIAPV